MSINLFYKSFFVSTICSISLVCLAQDNNAQSQIQHTFDAYIQSIKNKDFDKTVNYIYDKMFQYVSKEEMINSFEEIFNSEEIQINLGEVKYLTFEEIKQVEDYNYILFGYESNLQMNFEKLSFDNLEDKTSFTNLLNQNLNSEYGASNVHYNSKSNWYNIHTDKLVIAIRKKNKNNWKFIEYEEKQKGLMKSILPEKIYDNLLGNE